DFCSILETLVAHPNAIFSDHAFAEIRAAPKDVVEGAVCEVNNHIGIGTSAPERVPFRVQLERCIYRAKMFCVGQRRPMPFSQFWTLCRLQTRIGLRDLIGPKSAIVDFQFIEDSIQRIVSWERRRLAHQCGRRQVLEVPAYSQARLRSRINSAGDSKFPCELSIDIKADSNQWIVGCYNMIPLFQREPVC